MPVEEKSQTKQANAWSWISVVVCALLLGATSIKAWNFGRILATDGLLSNFYLLNFAIVGEAVAAIFILLARPNMSWLITITVFSGFVVVASYSLMSGVDCNCFGDRLGARISFPIDIAVLLLCALFRPKVDQLSFRIPCNAVVAAGLVLGAVLVAAANIRYAEMKRKPLAFLLAEDLVNKKWPINGNLDSRLSELEKRDWLILVVRKDCSHCQEILAKHFKDPKTHRSNERTAIFVAGGNDWPFLFDSVSSLIDESMMLSWSHEEPFVASPAVFLISDGQVTAAADGDKSDKMLERIFPVQPGSSRDH